MGYFESLNRAQLRVDTFNALFNQIKNNEIDQDTAALAQRLFAEMRWISYLRPLTAAGVLIGCISILYLPLSLSFVAFSISFIAMNILKITNHACRGIENVEENLPSLVALDSNFDGENDTTYSYKKLLEKEDNSALKFLLEIQGKQGQHILNRMLAEAESVEEAQKLINIGANPHECKDLERILCKRKAYRTAKDFSSDLVSFFLGRRKDYWVGVDSDLVSFFVSQGCTFSELVSYYVVKNEDIELISSVFKLNKEDYQDCTTFEKFWKKFTDRKFPFSGQHGGPAIKKIAGWLFGEERVVMIDRSLDNSKDKSEIINEYKLIYHIEPFCNYEFTYLEKTIIFVLPEGFSNKDIQNPEFPPLRLSKHWPAIKYSEENSLISKLYSNQGGLWDEFYDFFERKEGEQKKTAEEIIAKLDEMLRKGMDPLRKEFMISPGRELKRVTLVQFFLHHKEYHEVFLFLVQRMKDSSYDIIEQLLNAIPDPCNMDQVIALIAAENNCALDEVTDEHMLASPNIIAYVRALLMNNIPCDGLIEKMCKDPSLYRSKVHALFQRTHKEGNWLHQKYDLFLPLLRQHSVEEIFTLLNIDQKKLQNECVQCKDFSSASDILFRNYGIYFDVKDIHSSDTSSAVNRRAFISYEFTKITTISLRQVLEEMMAILFLDRYLSIELSDTGNYIPDKTCNMLKGQKFDILNSTSRKAHILLPLGFYYRSTENQVDVIKEGEILGSFQKGLSWWNYLPSPSSRVRNLLT